MKAALAEQPEACESMEKGIWLGSWLKALPKISPSLQIHLIPADTFIKENAGWWKFQPFNWHWGNKRKEFFASDWGPRDQLNVPELRELLARQCLNRTNKDPKSTGDWIIIMMHSLWKDQGEGTTENLWGYNAWNEIKCLLKSKENPGAQHYLTGEQKAARRSFYLFSNKQSLVIWLMVTSNHQV